MADHLDKEALQSIRDCFDRLVTFMECADRILGSKGTLKGTHKGTPKGALKETLSTLLIRLL